MGFGTGPLSQPLLVEAIEQEFVPVVVFNNKPGRDAELLARFSEPPWNNPVVRFLRLDLSDVIPRKDGVWSDAGLVARIHAALVAAGRPAPAWFDGFRAELCAVRQRALFAMDCFWEGEAALGAEPGVLATRAVFVGAGEAVEVWFDPDVASFARLVARAQALRCANDVFCEDGATLAAARALVGEKAKIATGEPRAAPASDQKHALRATPFRHLPLTPRQQALLNAALARGAAFEEWLSPRQREWAARLASEAVAARVAAAGLEPAATLAELRGYAERFEALLGVADAPSPAKR